MDPPKRPESRQSASVTRKRDEIKALANRVRRQLRDMFHTESPPPSRGRPRSRSPDGSPDPVDREARDPSSHSRYSGRRPLPSQAEPSLQRPPAPHSRSDDVPVMDEERTSRLDRAQIIAKQNEQRRKEDREMTRKEEALAKREASMERREKEWRKQDEKKRKKEELRASIMMRHEQHEANTTAENQAARRELAKHNIAVHDFAEPTEQATAMKSREAMAHYLETWRERFAEDAAELRRRQETETVQAGSQQGVTVRDFATPRPKWKGKERAP